LAIDDANLTVTLNSYVFAYFVFDCNCSWCDLYVYIWQFQLLFLQCSDAVGWATGRTSDM